MLWIIFVVGNNTDMISIVQLDQPHHSEVVYLFLCCLADFRNVSVLGEGDFRSPLLTLEQFEIS